MASRRQQILEVIKARLEAILIASDFNTDAGNLVFLNEEPLLGPDDPEVAVSIVINDDIVRGIHGKKLLIKLPLEIQAIARADISAPWIAVEQVLEDIKKAIELEDRSLGGLVTQSIERGSTRTVPREPGTSTVAAGIFYGCEYAEGWGAP